MTRGPAIWPTIVASTPKCASAWTSVSAVRWSAPLTPFATAGDVLSTARSGSTYAPSGRGASKSVVCSSVSPSGSSRSGDGSDSPSEIDVRIVVDDVDGRLVRGREETMVLLRCDLQAGRALERAAGGAVRAAHRVTGPAQERAVRGAREQEAAGEKRRQADEQRAGAAQERLDPAAEQVADEAAVVGAERASSAPGTRRRARRGTA